MAATSVMTSAHKLRCLAPGEPGLETQINTATQNTEWFHHILFKQLRDMSLQKDRNQPTLITEQKDQSTIHKVVREWETDVATMREVRDQLTQAYHSLNHK